MQIAIIADGAEALTPSGAVQSFPVGWTGIVPDAIGQKLVDDGFAEDHTPPAEPLMVTPRQAETLKNLADGIAATEDAGDALVVDWDQLDDEDLREIATALEVKFAHNTGRPKLIERLVERHDDVVAYLSAQIEPEGGEG